MNSKTEATHTNLAFIINIHTVDLIHQPVPDRNRILANLCFISQHLLELDVSHFMSLLLHVESSGHSLEFCHTCFLLGYRIGSHCISLPHSIESLESLGDLLIGDSIRSTPLELLTFFQFLSYRLILELVQINDCRVLRLKQEEQVFKLGLLFKVHK